MNVLIADDHALVGDLLKLALEQAGGDVRVTTAANFESALQLAHEPGYGKKPPFDIVLLDLNMPGMNGLNGLRRMRALLRDVPVAIISGTAAPSQAREFMREGAIGFLPKTMQVDEMMKAILSMAAGERYVSKYLMVGEHSQTIATRPEVPDALRSLTKREHEVLLELIQGWGNKRIAQNLGLGEPTIKVHLRGLFHKLGAKNRTDAVRIGLTVLSSPSPQQPADPAPAPESETASQPKSPEPEPIG